MSERECGGVVVRVSQHGVRFHRVSHITLAYVYTHIYGRVNHCVLDSRVEMHHAYRPFYSIEDVLSRGAHVRVCGSVRELCLNPDGCRGTLKVARDHRHLVIEWRDMCTCMHDDV